MPHHLPTLDEIIEALDQRIEKKLIDNLPRLIREASRKEFLTTEELEELTGWSRGKIYDMRKKHGFPFIKEGRSVLFKMEDIERYLEKNRISLRDNG